VRVAADDAGTAVQFCYTASRDGKRGLGGDPRRATIGPQRGGPVARRAGAATPEYGEIGEHLREVRLRRGISVRELARRLGVSASLISQVETGRARPSVRTLYAVANELGISLDELLFSDARATGGGPERNGSGPEPAAALDLQLPADPVQRAADRTTIRLASGVVWERLTTASIPGVDFLQVTYEVGGASSPEREFQRHAGQEWGYVVSGRLGVTIGFDDVVLEPGDSIAFDSTTPHRLYNAGAEPVHGIWFVLGRRSGPAGETH
jgi:transcriptional regulator with XRE-family HTH domain